MDEKYRELQVRIEQLEQKIKSLRLGRRILMNLLIETEQAKKREIHELKRQIKRLKQRLKK